MLSVLFYIFKIYISIFFFLWETVIGAPNPHLSLHPHPLPWLLGPEGVFSTSDLWFDSMMHFDQQSEADMTVTVEPDP